MRTIRLLHLYYNLMNLYGGYSNVEVLRRHLEEQGLTVEVDKKTLGDDIDFSNYDFVYAGAGTERGQKEALRDLSRYREAIKKAAEEGCVMLFCGNAFDMLGASVTDFDGNTYEGLGIFSFSAEESAKRRFTGDVICETSWGEEPFVGFVNHCAVLSDLQDPCFTMKAGGDAYLPSLQDGARFRNVFGMHMIGAVLVNNPPFLELIIRLIGEKIPEFSYQKKEYPGEEAIYRMNVEELGKIAAGSVV